ncbi:MAG: SDR family NAD(P)-dependent oxidoreductase, partial [Methylobacterium sp.]
LGPMRLTAALLPQMRAAGDPVVVTVSSGLAFVPKIDSPTYSASKAAIHSWTVSLRTQLEGAVEVIELVPPGVQTDLTPGQATREGYLPLDAFIDEVMGLWGQVPTPQEITVGRVLPLRRAEAEGRFAQALAMVNGR